MQKIYFILLLITISSCSQAQENRRATYYETFLEVNEPIDSMVVFKSTRELVTYHQRKKVKKYMISLGEASIGKKQVEGDMKTPEGHYYINSRDTNSAYHTNLGISYPNAADSMHAAAHGIRAGGDIKIHGFPNRHSKLQEKQFLNTDWTLGCIAVSDFEIDELYKWVIPNSPILILP